MGRLWFGNRPVTLLVGDNKTVNIDTSLDITSDNPVTNKAITTEIDVLNTELLAVKSDLFNANQEIETLTLALQSSDYEIDNLTVALQNANNEINDLKSIVQTMQADIVTIQNELQLLTNDVRGHLDNLVEIPIDEMRGDISTLKSDVDTLKGYHSSNEGILDDLVDLEDMFG